MPGLRREEVALLAGVSTDYYTRLEQGRPITPSPAVVEALCRALRLDEAGRAHLHDLIGVAAAPARGRGRSVQRLRPGMHRLVDALDEPALVLGRRSDVLAANRMCKALFTDFDAMPTRHRNYARWMFLSEESRALFVDWEEHARAAVESLRLEVGRDRDDPGTNELVAELREKSAQFNLWWEDHRVHQRTYGSKRLHHPLVGELTVEYETLLLPGDPDTALFIYTTEPGSSSKQALDLLAMWALAGAETPLPGTPPRLRSSAQIGAVGVRVAGEGDHPGEPVAHRMQVADLLVDADLLGLQLLQESRGRLFGSRVHARQDLADHSARQTRGVELLDQADPGDGGVGVVPLAAGATGSGEQILFLVVTQCANAYPCLVGDLTDAHRTSSGRAAARLTPDVNVRS